MPPEKQPIDIGVDIDERGGQKLVGITFGKKIKWVGLTASEAEALGAFLLKKAAEIRGQDA